MNTIERRATLSIATLFSFRMLGLFMILPVFAPYAQHLPHATPLLIGLALGIYGLTQAIFQLPFGAWSDRMARKPVIATGFLIFIVGSLLAGFSHTLTGIIVGRALQGAGAVGSTMIALLSDLTRAEKRSKCMAILGVTIGCAFFLAMMLGPIIDHWTGVQGIFLLTALFGVAAIGVLYRWVPTPEKRITQTSATPPLLQSCQQLLKHPALLSLDLGIFCLHAILTALFIAIPLQLEVVLKPGAATWPLYVVTMLIAVVLTFGFIGWAESKKRVVPLYRAAIGGLIIAILALWHFHANLTALGIGLTLFFTAFNLLEANLPSLISRAAPPEMKGAAIGIYSTFQYSGIFIGGLAGGWLYQHSIPATVFLACAIMAGLWFIVAMITRLHLVKST